MLTVGYWLPCHQHPALTTCWLTLCLLLPKTRPYLLRTEFWSHLTLPPRNHAFSRLEKRRVEQIESSRSARHYSVVDIFEIANGARKRSRGRMEVPARQATHPARASYFNEMNRLQQEASNYNKFIVLLVQRRAPQLRVQRMQRSTLYRASQTAKKRRDD